MRKLVIFLWLSIFMQCQIPIKECSLIPKIDNSFEKFNIEIFEKNQQPNIYVIDEKNQKTILFLYSEGYGLSIYNKYSVYKIDKLFYMNGEIKAKSIAFTQGTPVGIRYYFDESGKFIKEENTDEGYTFTPEDLVKYCEKSNIELSKGYHEGDGYQTSVYKNELDGKKVWQISYLISLNKQEKEIKLTLDGQTGKVIKREEFPYDSY